MLQNVKVNIIIINFKIRWITQEFKQRLLEE